MFDPRDITPHSIYEEMEWVGLEGQCDRCRIIYYIPRPGLSGRCPKCEYGWVWFVEKCYTGSESIIYKPEIIPLQLYWNQLLMKGKVLC